MKDINEKILKAQGDTQSPAERRAEKGKAAATIADLPTLGSKVSKVAASLQKKRDEKRKFDNRLASAKVPSLKDVERLAGPIIYNVGLSQPKTRTKHIDTNVVQAGFGPTGDKVPAPPREKGPDDTPEVRPDVPELTGGAKLTKGEVGATGGMPARTSYREPPKKPTPDRRGIPQAGLSAVKNWRWKDSALGKAHADRTADDLIPGRSPSGTSGVGSKPTQHPNSSTAGTPRANQPPTQSSSQGLAIRGSVGKEGSKKRDIKDRNIVTPEKPTNDSISREMTAFLMEYIIKAPVHGIARWTPKQGTFTPLRDLEPPPMPEPNPDANDPRMAEVPKAAKALGIDLAKGKLVNPSSRPKDKAAASKELFGEDTMNPDKIANDIIREAFTSGDRNNVSTSNTAMAGPGSIPRQMLSGEFFGSTAWPFDEPLSPDFAKTNELQADQAVSGQGDGVVGNAMESVGAEIVDNLLEDSPSSIYSDVESVGYLINELRESGYAEQAETITAICEDAKEEDVVKIADIIEKMEAEKADPFLIEQLAKFANLLMEEDETAKTDTEVPTGEDNKDEIEASNTGGSGL